jgi:hypothetical protein
MEVFDYYPHLVYPMPIINLSLLAVYQKEMRTFDKSHTIYNSRLFFKNRYWWTN